MYSAYNNHSQPDWQPNSYPPTNSPPRKPSPYDHSGPVNASLSPSPNIDRAQLMRTPSPTPSEQKELTSGAIDWKGMMDWRFWFRREWLWYYVALVIITTITALVTIYHEQIVHWLTPVTRWLHDLKFGWLVPIGILFMISFPPLFGHEIVAILCGLVWGLWIGFGIVSAGTFLGEVGNFYAFKYCCSARGEKLEKTKISYACLAKVVRDGGFWVALIARYSAIPGHFTTAVFSTCGMGIFVFSIAAILSMPKQLITVYLGVILEQSSDGQEDRSSQIISRAVLAVTVLVTVLAMWYILHKMNAVKPQVIYERRKARQAKLTRQSLYGNNNLSGSEMFTGTNNSMTDIPLAAPPKKNSNYGYGAGQAQPYPFGADYQRSNNSPVAPSFAGNPYRSNSNSGYDLNTASDNIMYAPKPQSSGRYYAPTNAYQNYGEHEEGAGHVAPGAGVGAAYDYTPTRQDSDEDGSAMAAQQEEYLRRYRERQPTFPPPGIPPSSAIPPRTLTQSPDALSSHHEPSDSHSSLAYNQSTSQPQSLSQSHSTPAQSLHSIPPLQSSYSSPLSQPFSQQQAYSSPTRTNVGYPTSPSYPNPFPSPSQPSQQHQAPSSYAPETRQVDRTPTVASFNPYSPRGYGGHVVEPTDATFHTAVDHGSRQDSLVEEQLHAPGALGRTQSPPPPSYMSLQR